MIHVISDPPTVTVNGKPDPVRLALSEELREWQLETNAQREAERKRIAEIR